MKYGLIGQKLPHSFSKTIHESIGGYEYELIELEPDEVELFLRRKDFCAVNVTIPYKQTVIPFLDKISEEAKAIGAVNTIVNRGGRLFGYNTDTAGMSELIFKIGIDFSGKNVMILGSGGTSKTAAFTAEKLGAAGIIKVSRKCLPDAITYDDIWTYAQETDILINTTPVGMYPGLFDKPLELEGFDRLYAVIDVIYNPLRTLLLQDAKARGIICAGGLYMLVSQAVHAYSLFTGKDTDTDLSEKIYRMLLSEKENIVLTGMPGSGKTTVGRLLSEKTGKELIDTDELIIKRTGSDIPALFDRLGEAGFRRIEKDIIKDLSSLTGKIISTGGGSILDADNIRALKLNGRICYLKRPLELIVPTKDRPLSSDVRALKQRYAERKEIYENTADITISNTGTPLEATEAILKGSLK